MSKTYEIEIHNKVRNIRYYRGFDNKQDAESFYFFMSNIVEGFEQHIEIKLITPTYTQGGTLSYL